jgi:hypothetical protein
MEWLVGHREPKAADTEMLRLPPPRQSSTLPLAAEAEPQLSTMPIPADFRVRPERPELSARLTAIVISH